MHKWSFQSNKQMVSHNQPVTDGCQSLVTLKFKEFSKTF